MIATKTSPTRGAPRLPGNLRLLGLFPDFEHGAGGVQLSGRLAWDALSRAAREAGGTAHLLSYAPRLHAPPPPRGGVTVARSRPAALAAALRQRGSSQLLLSWHVDLLPLAVLARGAGADVACFVHGIEVWRRLDPLRTALLPRVGAYFSNSEYTWQRALQFLPELDARPHRVVALGAGEALAAPTPEPDRVPAALKLGRRARSEDYKGHREVLRAWPAVLAKLPDAQLWIAGDGDLRPDLEALVRALGIGANVRFFGRVTELGKERLLRRCRCLALPSRGEGFGLVYVEAMRFGRPSLVSDADAGREVVGDTGIAVDPARPDEIAEGLLRLLRGGSEWDGRAARARARYESGFTERHFQDRLLAAVAEIGT